MIELEMQEWKADDKHVILTDDFNAKTGIVVNFMIIMKTKEKINFVDF